jgi:hypothetical protein
MINSASPRIPLQYNRYDIFYIIILVEVCGENCLGTDSVRFAMGASGVYFFLRKPGAHSD